MIDLILCDEVIEEILLRLRLSYNAADLLIGALHQIDQASLSIHNVDVMGAVILLTFYGLLIPLDHTIQIIIHAGKTYDTSLATPISGNSKLIEIEALVPILGKVSYMDLLPQDVMGTVIDLWVVWAHSLWKVNLWAINM